MVEGDVVWAVGAIFVVSVPLGCVSWMVCCVMLLWRVGLVLLVACCWVVVGCGLVAFGFVGFWIGETPGETLGVQILMVALLVAAKRTVSWCFDCFGWRLCWSDGNGSVFYWICCC